MQNSNLTPCFYESVPFGLKQQWKVQAFRDKTFMPSLAGHTTFVDTFDTPEEAIKCARGLKWENEANDVQCYQKIIIERVFKLKDDGE
jgi:hypothetical protein